MGPPLTYGLTVEIETSTGFSHRCSGRPVADPWLKRLFVREIYSLVLYGILLLGMELNCQQWFSLGAVWFPPT